MGISVVLHPLILPTYIFILLGYFSPLAIAPLNTLSGRTFLIGLIFLSTFFLPLLLLILYLMIQNSHWTIKKFLMENSRERVFPLLMIGTFYTVIIYFIRIRPELNDIILIVMTCTTIAVLTVAFISNFWKISIHAVSISGMIGILAILNNKVPNAALFFPILILLFFAGCLMSARLYLNAHNPLQILVGIILGLFISGMGGFFI